MEVIGGVRFTDTVTLLAFLRPVTPQYFGKALGRLTGCPITSRRWCHLPST